MVAMLACERDVLNNVNHMPVIMSVTYSPTTIYTEETAQLRVEAIDEDADELTYFWSAEAGAFNVVTGEGVIWTAPAFAGDYEILVSASDLRTTVSTVVRVPVRPNQFGGTVTFTSDPLGAEIILDGVNTGFTTPHDFVGLEVREHIVSLTHDERFLFPDTAVVFIREDLDTLLNFRFMTTDVISPADWTLVSAPSGARSANCVFTAQPGAGQDVGIWRNGINEQPGSVSEVPPLGQEGEDLAFPRWQDTQRIFYQVGVADTGARIFRMSAGGGQPTPVDLGGDARRAGFDLEGIRMGFVRHEREGNVYRTSLAEAREFLDPVPEVIILRTYESTEGRIVISPPSFSADASTIVYSVRMPSGEEDLYAYDRLNEVEHQLTTSGDRTWPTIDDDASTVFFAKTDGSGIFGASLTRVNPWRLGRPMRFAGQGGEQPHWARQGTTGPPYVVFVSDSRVYVNRNLGD